MGHPMQNMIRILFHYSNEWTKVSIKYSVVLVLVCGTVECIDSTMVLDSNPVPLQR